MNEFSGYPSIIFIVFTVLCPCSQSSHALLDWFMSLSLELAIHSNNTIWLWCGLNLLLRIENCPFAVLQVSCSKLMKGSLPRQFLIIGNFSSSVNWYAFIWSMIVTSISKLANYTYLSLAFQSNEGFSSASPLCLCLMGFLGLAASVAYLDPTHVSLSAIITAVAAWMAAWLTADCIVSNSATSSSICVFLYFLF